MMEHVETKVLICDDSILVRKKLRVLLEDEFSCVVTEAANGREAISLYQKEHPHIVFMDIVMPECDGLEALKKIKELDDKARVVMVSSTGTSTKLIDALKLGAVDFIQKPYDKEQIGKAILNVRS